MSHGNIFSYWLCKPKIITYIKWNILCGISQQPDWKGSIFMAMLIRNRMGNFLSQPVPFSMMHKQTLLQLPRHGPWRRQWNPTPVFLPRKSHGQRSWVGYSPRSHRKLDMTERSTLWLFTSGYIHKKAGAWTPTCTFVHTAAQFIVAKRWQQPRSPLTDEWVNKMWYKY